MYLGWGAAEVDQYVFLIVYLVSGLLAAGYLFPIVIRAFLRSSPDHTRYGEADVRMVATHRRDRRARAGLGYRTEPAARLLRARVDRCRCRLPTGCCARGRDAMSIDRRFALIIVVGIVLSALSEVFFVDHRKYLFAGSTLLLFWVGFGFVGCVGIVVVSKWVGHTFLMKHNDPYTGEHVEAEPGEHRDG